MILLETAECWKKKQEQVTLFLNELPVGFRFHSFSRWFEALLKNSEVRPAVKQLSRAILPPRCFTAGPAFLCTSGCCDQEIGLFWSKKLSFRRVSFVYVVTAVNFSQTWRCWLCSRGFFLGLQPLSPWWCKELKSVFQELPVLLQAFALMAFVLFLTIWTSSFLH